MINNYNLSAENSDVTSINSEATVIEAAIEKCLELSECEYQINRKKIAQDLGVTLVFLDKAVTSKRAATNDLSASTTAHEPGDALALTPSDELADGAAVHKEMTTLITRYMHLPDKRFASIVALWCMYTHALDAFRIAPKLLITAPEKSCGKSTLVEIVAALACRCEAMIGISPAIIYRLIEKFRPTMAFDEVDNMRNSPGFDEISAVMNAGHKRGSYVWRCTGDAHEPTKFFVFAPQVIAMIGKPKSTTTSRSIVVSLERATVEESSLLNDITDIDPMVEWEPLRKRALRWGQDNLDDLRRAPHKPYGVYGRHWDNWRPLLRVAEVIGGSELQQLTLAMCTESIGGAAADSIQSRTWDAICIASKSYINQYPAEKNIRSEDLYRYALREDRNLQNTYPNFAALSRFVSPYVSSKTVRVSYCTKPRKGWEIKSLISTASRYGNS